MDKATVVLVHYKRRRDQDDAWRRRQQGQADDLREPRHRLPAARRVDRRRAEVRGEVPHDGCVVLVQKGGTEGLIIGAAQKKLDPAYNQLI